MIIGINTTTLYRGGALQVAYSLIEELSKTDNTNEFIIFCLDELINQLKQINLPNNFILVKIEFSTAKIRTRRMIIALLDEYIHSYKIQVVLTVFGPSYWKPNVPHICGFADGWCTNPDSVAYELLPFSQRIKRKLLNKYKLIHLKKESQLFFIETEYAKQKFVKISGIHENLISVVGNTYNAAYLSQENQTQILPERESGEIRFLILSANYPHKNIAILNQVIPLLERTINKFYFITTLPSCDFEKLFSPNVKPFIKNIGPIPVTTCVQLYREIDFTFLPTLLESFTATYPESMFMAKPILTSDLPFARDICKDAAIYFNPLSPVDIVKKINTIIFDQNIISQLVINGRKRVLEFPSANERANKLLELCKQYDGI